LERLAPGIFFDLLDAALAEINEDSARQVLRGDQRMGEGWVDRYFSYLFAFVSFRILAASPAISRWASAKVSDFAELFSGISSGPEALFNGPDDAGKGLESFNTEGRSLGFFISVSICSIFLSRCFPDAN
jgi:hypothetical protein